MGSKFLKKYRATMSVNHPIEELQLTVPINKNIKSNQIYQDSIISPASKFQPRLASQSPRVLPSFALEPILFPPRHKDRKHSKKFRDNSVDVYPPQLDEYRLPVHSNERHSRKSNFEFRIHSQINSRVPNYKFPGNKFIDAN